LIVLDTHAWLWWLADPDRLSDAARAATADATAIGVSTVSAWELATLVRRRRIELDRDVRDWVRRAFAEERVSALAPSAEVALAAALLDERTFPRDPADRLIFATARALDAPLVTRDANIRGFAPSETIW
jgi:PIN domain nuclease of toxin-antitoxin system